MTRKRAFWSTTIGKKTVMAVTGLILVGSCWRTCSAT
jgi:hypothetical protein